MATLTPDEGQSVIEQMLDVLIENVLEANRVLTDELRRIFSDALGNWPVFINPFSGPERVLLLALDLAGAWGEFQQDIALAPSRAIATTLPDSIDFGPKLRGRVFRGDEAIRLFLSEILNTAVDLIDWDLPAEIGAAKAVKKAAGLTEAFRAADRIQGLSSALRASVATWVFRAASVVLSVGAAGFLTAFAGLILYRAKRGDYNRDTLPQDSTRTSGGRVNIRPGPDRP